MFVKAWLGAIQVWESRDGGWLVIHERNDYTLAGEAYLNLSPPYYCSPSPHTHTYTHTHMHTHARTHLTGVLALLPAGTDHAVVKRELLAQLGPLEGSLARPTVHYWQIHFLQLALEVASTTKRVLAPA